MKLFYWNVRGIANDPSRNSLYSFCKEFSPYMICLAEPMANPTHFSLSFLRSINMYFVAFNSCDNMSKIWPFCSNRLR